MTGHSALRPHDGELSGARLGGRALIVAAILFIAAFSWLAEAFNYPDVLDGPSDQVLPRLLALGATGRAVWAGYAILPLLLVPAGVGAHAALARRAPARMQAALLLAVISAVVMMLGLMRWPTIHWSLALALVAAPGEGERAVIGALFDGFNLYLGNYLGEFVGELALNAFFLLVALAMHGDARFPRWAARAGTLAALLGFVAMWRNVTAAASVVAEVENYVLPLWMIGQGVLLARLKTLPATADR